MLAIVIHFCNLPCSLAISCLSTLFILREGPIYGSQLREKPKLYYRSLKGDRYLPYPLGHGPNAQDLANKMLMPGALESYKDPIQDY